jgi:hypothetical protein
MVERYVKRVQEHLRKVVSTHQRDWDKRLTIFLLAYRAATHETTGVTPASMVFGRELRLSCDLMFGAPPDREQSVTSYAANLVELHDIRHFARQHLKVASDRIKARYDQLGFKKATECGFTTLPGREGNYPSCMRAGKAPTSSPG